MKRILCGLFLWSIMSVGVAQEALAHVPFYTQDWEAFKQHAQDNNLPYYVDFWAEWCVPCQRMESTVFNQKQVINYTDQHFLAYKVNIDSPEGRAIMQEYGVTQFPTVLFFLPDGELLGFEPGMFTSNTFFEAMRLYRKLQFMKSSGLALPHTDQGL